MPNRLFRSKYKLSCLRMIWTFWLKAEKNSEVISEVWSIYISQVSKLYWELIFILLEQKVNIKCDFSSHVLKKLAKYVKAVFVVYQIQYRKQTCHEAPVKTVDFKKGTNKNFSLILTVG